MGAKYQLKCGSCGYRAEVCGGKDIGMTAVVETMTCHDCKDLVDVLIGQYGEEGGAENPELNARLGACPQCEGTKVVPWDGARPCPHCGAEMSPDETTITMREEPDDP